MNKEKDLQNNGDYPEDIPEVHSFEPSSSDIEKLKKLYLPSSKANNNPSEEEIEEANDLNYSKPDTLL